MEAPTVDAAELARVFGRAVASYDVEPIDPHLRLHSVTGGVFRVRSGADCAVLKVVRHGDDPDPAALWVSGATAEHRNYWKREWLAYDSGLLDALPGALRAPRRLDTTERSARECRIWMQDVCGRTGAALTDDDYARVARDLGTTQGAFARGEPPLPTYPWLSRQWLRGWLDANTGNAERLDDGPAWEREPLARFRSLRSRAAQVWRHREQLLGVLAEAPATLVHLDLWPANVIVTADGGTVAVDWSQVGIGALAQDLDQLTLDPVWMQVRPGTPPEHLEELVLPGYLRGLAAAGLAVGERELRRWYAAAASVRYVALLGGQVATLADRDAVAAQERRFGRPYPAILREKAVAVRRAVELGEQLLGG